MSDPEYNMPSFEFAPEGHEYVPVWEPETGPTWAEKRKKARKKRLIVELATAAVSAIMILGSTL